MGDVGGSSHWCVSLKGLSCAQGLPSASLMYPRPHILPADPLPHFRSKALELADLGPKPLKLLASVNLLHYFSLVFVLVIEHSLAQGGRNNEVSLGRQKSIV